MKWIQLLYILCIFSTHLLSHLLYHHNYPPALLHPASSSFTILFNFFVLLCYFFFFLYYTYSASSFSTYFPFLFFFFFLLPLLFFSILLFQLFYVFNIFVFYFYLLGRSNTVLIGGPGFRSHPGRAVFFSSCNLFFKGSGCFADKVLLARRKTSIPFPLLLFIHSPAPLFLVHFFPLFFLSFLFPVKLVFIFKCRVSRMSFKPSSSKIGPTFLLTKVFSVNGVWLPYR